MSSGTVGSRGIDNSYARNAAINIPPRMRGARTCTLVHGYEIPPHVKAMSASVVPAIIRKFPLEYISIRFYCKPDAQPGGEVCSRPIQTFKFFPDGPFRCAYAKEDRDERERDPCEG